VQESNRHNIAMNFQNIQSELREKGYYVVPNVLSENEVQQALGMFNEWEAQPGISNLNHHDIGPHGIYKFHEVGHQRHAWYIRTRPNVQRVFKELWNTESLISSFDGTCHMRPHDRRKNNIWTHTDQAPNAKGFMCYQAFVSLTSNKERTFVAYEGTHEYHRKYFEEKGIESNDNWQLIDHETIARISDKKRVLDVEAGSLVLWDSRTFHQNQYSNGDISNEERIVQYVCFLPSNHPKNTDAMHKKRLKYFQERRTTSHWPAPIKVIGLQPRTFGDDSRLINYDQLIKPNLDDMMSDITKLL